jgi:hypothetical protein
MKKRTRFGFIFLTALVLAACNRPIQSKTSLIKYLNDAQNGLTQVREINRIKAAVTFMPWQVIASRLYQTKAKDTSVMKVIKSKYYFVLGLSANGKELLHQLPFEQYSEMVQVLAFRMRPYVSIVRDDGKVVQAEDCLFQQTYGMGKENEVLLVFDRSDLKNTNHMDLKINEFGLNTGNLDYKINTKDINQMPTIAIN